MMSLGYVAVAVAGADVPLDGGRDADAAGVGALIEISHGPCVGWRPAARPRLVVSNPPWGNRLLGGREAGHLPGNTGPASTSSGGPQQWDRGGSRAARESSGSQVDLRRTDQGDLRAAGRRDPRRGDQWDPRGSLGRAQQVPDGGRGSRAESRGRDGERGRFVEGCEEEDLASAWHDLGVFLKVRFLGRFLARVSRVWPLPGSPYSQHHGAACIETAVWSSMHISPGTQS